MTTCIWFQNFFVLPALATTCAAILPTCKIDRSAHISVLTLAGCITKWFDIYNGQLQLMALNEAAI